MSCLQWYAVEVRSRKEQLVASVLTQKDHECFLPLYQSRKVWSDRIKTSAVPLFAGYVFSRFDATHRLPILITPCVRSIVGTDNGPTPIDDSELEAIRIATQNGLSLEPCDHLQDGDRVVVTKGLLTGIEGSFVRYRGSDRLILSVSLIHRSVAIEIDRAYIQPLSQPSALRSGHPRLTA
jgi:transcription antitermination factor NusG